MKWPLVSERVGREASGSRKLEEQLIALFDEHRERVYRYLIHIKVLPEEAEDVIQETFLRLFQHMSDGGRTENVRAWIFQVAHNVAFTQRRNRRWLTFPSPEQWEEFSASSADLAPNPEELILLKEKMTRVHLAASTLSPQQMQCLSLRVEGFRYREIAEILGVTVSTVSQSLRRAIAKLTGESHG